MTNVAELMANLADYERKRARLIARLDDDEVFNRTLIAARAAAWAARKKEMMHADS